MASKQHMYYIGFCQICSTGPLGLRRCGNCGKVVVLCDECDAVWTSADLQAKPQLYQAEELSCPECKSSLIDSPSGWATQAQIEATKWLQQALDNGDCQLHQGSAFAPDATDTDK
jgi:hypothetical protein